MQTEMKNKPEETVTGTLRIQAGHLTSSLVSVPDDE